MKNSCYYQAKQSQVMLLSVGPVQRYTRCINDAQMMQDVMNISVVQ